MARIFTIYFNYEGSMHHAVVSVRTTPFFTEYTLNHFSEDLMEQLPGNKIISRTPDEFFFQYSKPEHATTLMNEIIRAVAEHLQTTDA